MSGFQIITADQRVAETTTTGVILGGSKIGKTSLLHTLDPKTTLFVDLEAGGLSVADWGGDQFEVRDWQKAKDLAVYLGGPNPATPKDQPYGLGHYEYVVSKWGNPAEKLDKYKTIFVDSLTVAGRLCLGWSKNQPEAFSERTGKPDTRGAYGLHGQEMMRWLTHLQHIKGKHVWFVAILEEQTDEFNRKIYVPQIDGSKVGRELPGIVDEVITMAELAEYPDKDGNPGRVFICTRPNKWGFPAGDRSRRLSQVEPPNLGELINKILSPLRPEQQVLNYDLPQPTDQQPQTEQRAEV